MIFRKIDRWWYERTGNELAQDEMMFWLFIYWILMTVCGVVGVGLAVVISVLDGKLIQAVVLVLFGGVAWFFGTLPVSIYAHETPRPRKQKEYLDECEK